MVERTLHAVARPTITLGTLLHQYQLGLVLIAGGVEGGPGGGGRR